MARVAHLGFRGNGAETNANGQNKTWGRKKGVEEGGLVRGKVSGDQGHRIPALRYCLCLV